MYLIKMILSIVVTEYRLIWNLTTYQNKYHSDILSNYILWRKMIILILNQRVICI